MTQDQGAEVTMADGQGFGPSLGSFDWKDPFLLSDQLTEDERMVAESAAAYAADKLQPRVRAAYREERVEEALTSWRRAFDLEPGDRLRDKILKAERELAVSRNYDYAASPHFNLRYDGDVDVDLAP